MKNLLLTLTCLLAVAPLSGAGLMPQNVNARLSTAVQSPYDLCFYLEQQQWDQVDAVIKRVPSNYQFDTYKQNTPLMVAIELYAKRVADKPKTFWQTTAGGLVKMVAGSALVVLGMAGLGGRGNDYMDPLKGWIRIANENLDDQNPAPQPAAAAPAFVPQQAPQINQPNMAAAPANAPVFPLYGFGVQGAHAIHEVRQALPHMVNGVHRVDQAVQQIQQAAQRMEPRVNAAVQQVGQVANDASRAMRSGKIWAARLLGFAALAAGIRFCWQGGQKLKSMLSFHSRSDELEHYKDVISQLLHREDLILGTQNSDGDTALSLVRKHMANSTRDREAYQLFADIEQLILIRGA